MLEQQTESTCFNLARTRQGKISGIMSVHKGKVSVQKIVQIIDINGGSVRSLQNSESGGAKSSTHRGLHCLPKKASAWSLRLWVAVFVPPVSLNVVTVPRTYWLL